MRKLVLIPFLTLLPFAAWAKEAGKPPEIDRVIHAHNAYGTGNYDCMGISVYDASLWTDAPRWSFATVFALSLHYDLDLDSKDIIDRSIEDMSSIDPLPEDIAVNYREQLQLIIPDIANGDTMTAIYVPGKELQFYHNGHFTGFIADMVFANRFIGIWLSPHTEAPDLRRQLLNLPTD